MTPAHRTILREAALLLAVIAVLAVAASLVGCTYPVAPPVTPPPGPVLPPPGPVEPPPPPVTPPPAPASVEEILSRITVGQTVAEVTGTVGSAPQAVPGSQGAPPSLRWLLVLPDGTFLVYATLGPDGRVAAKGWARVGSNP